MESKCQECGEPMVETEPDPDDLWFEKLQGEPLMLCPRCGLLQAEETE